nr:methyltransferase [Lactobacillus acidophilus]
MIAYNINTGAGVFSRIAVDIRSGVLIKAMKDHSFSKTNILVVGTGYGPIELLSAKFLPDQEGDMIDVNERGLLCAAENAKVNNYEIVNIYASICYEQ